MHRVTLAATLRETFKNLLYLSRFFAAISLLDEALKLVQPPTLIERS